MEATDNSSVDQDENIEKVRDLLFGSEIKKHDKNLNSVKAEFDGKLTALKSHIDSQFDVLKSMIEQQNTPLTNRVQKIESSSDEKYVIMSQKISDANERNLKTFESISKTQNGELAQIEKTLYSEIEKLATDTQRDISILREIKLNRNMLGKIFQEAGEKLVVKK